jgi:F0F1-type ATP synthase epsilon subunit
MAMTLHVDIVSAEAAIYSGLAEFVVVPAEMGEVGIYPRHTPLLTRIKAGSVRIKAPDRAEEDLIYVSSGILEVQRYAAPTWTRRARWKPRARRRKSCATALRRWITRRRRRNSRKPWRNWPPSRSCARSAIELEGRRWPGFRPHRFFQINH